MLRHTSFAIAAALSLGAAAHARAQRTATPDSIPRELVEALLRPGLNTYPGSDEFFIGRVPPVLQPYLYVPSDARVLGGLSTSSSTIAVLVTRAPASQVAADYQRELPKLGWTRPQGYGGGWGFVPAQGATTSGAGLEFCHIGQSLQITPTTINSTTQIVATVQNYGSRCAVVNTPRPTLPSGMTLLPTLVNPIGMLMNPPSCTPQAFGGGYGITERLQTAMTPAQLLDAFSKQLADSGWKTSPSGPTVGRVYTLADTGGLMRQVTVTAGPGAAGCVDVSMNVRLVPARP